MIVIPSLKSAEYCDTVRRVRESVVANGVAIVKVNRQRYEVKRIYVSMMPDRPLFVALSRRREFMRRTVAELMAELVGTMSSGTLSEFEFRQVTGPVKALREITGSLLSSPGEHTPRPPFRRREPSPITLPLRRSRRSRSDSASLSDV